MRAAADKYWRKGAAVLSLRRGSITTRLRASVLWLLLGSFLLLAGFFSLDALFPVPYEQPQGDYARVVTDRNGNPLRAFADSEGIWRYPTTVDEVSPHYLEALLHYEDRWFYQHPGVNPLALIRALGQRLYHGEWVSGGSTLTMQVARILQPHNKSLWGKLQQMFRALQLEWHLDKREILQLYLNRAPFGGPLQGVQAASFTYFGKAAEQLSHAEAALLAVLPQAPSYYRPDRYPDRARQARDKVLERLADFRVWSPALVKEAKAEPVLAQYNSHPLVAPLLARRLVRNHPGQRVFNSTIDRNLQLNVEQVLKQYMESFPEKTSAAVLILDNSDMNVLAYVGTADFGNPDRFGHVDMIQATRSPGSTLKPFLYGLALDAGLIHEQSLLLDVPSEFGDYRPENFDDGFHGPVAAREALRRSLNVPAVQVLNALSPASFHARLASAGLPLQLPGNAKPNLSLILGGAGTNLENLTAAFAGLGRGGRVGQPKFLMDQTTAVERRLMSPEAAWITANILSEARLNRFDNRSAIANSRARMAFKTGTSYGYRDAWVLATSEKVSVGVWVGRPDGTALSNNYGRQTAVPLLRRLLRLFPQQQLALPERPPSVTRHTICWPLGSLKKLQEPHWCRREKQAWLINQQAPATTLRDPRNQFWSGTLLRTALNADHKRVTAHCDQPIESHKTFALWPASLKPWLPRTQHRGQILPPVADSCTDTTAQGKLEIVGIEDNTELYPPPGQTTLPPITVATPRGEKAMHWFLNGRWMGQQPELRLTQLQPGQHQLSVMDAQGQTAQVQFRVGR